MRPRSRAASALYAGAALLGVIGSAGSAGACVQAPYNPGETKEAWQARQIAESEAYERERQRELWSKADRVFTARVAPPEPPPAAKPYDPRRDGPPTPPKPITFDSNYWETPLTLEPVAKLKGAPPPRSFEIVQTTSMTSCGFMTGINGSGSSFNQKSLSEGDVVVVFLKGAYPTRKGILGTLTPDQLVDPAVAAAFAKAAAR